MKERAALLRARMNERVAKIARMDERVSRVIHMVSSRVIVIPRFMYSCIALTGFVDTPA
jgi:hypothetical protein